MASTPEYPLYAGLVALLLANALAGLVSAQIFGDPFVGIFLPFLVGVVLSGARLRPVAPPAAASAGAAEPRAPVSTHGN